MNTPCWDASGKISLGETSHKNWALNCKITTRGRKQFQNPAQDPTAAQSRGNFPFCSPSTSNTKKNRIISSVGIFAEFSQSYMEIFWSWGPSTDPSQTPHDGICSLLSLPELPKKSDLFLLSSALFKVFKGAALAGFIHNFFGFLAQIPNLNHRPGEGTTTTISPFSLTPKQKTPSDLGTSTLVTHSWNL